MKRKIILGTVALIGLLLATGLVLAGCGFLGGGKECIGNGECTITIKQGTTGLSIDYDSPRSDCGKSSTYNYDLGEYTGGCKVNDMNSSWYQTSAMRYGTHSCDCNN